MRDIFVNKRQFYQYTLLFLFATGGVYYVNDAGQCAQIFNVDGPVLTLLHYDEKNILITVTESMLLTQHFITPEGEAREVLKVCWW